jgi:hypothetical protein
MKTKRMYITLAILLYTFLLQEGKAIPEWIESSFVYSFADTVCLVREGQLRKGEAAGFYVDLVRDKMRKYGVSEEEIRAILGEERFDRRVYEAITEEGGCKAIVKDILERGNGRTRQEMGE